MWRFIQAFLNMDIIRKFIYFIGNIIFLFLLASSSIADESIQQVEEKATYSSQLASSDILIIAKENKRCIRCHQKERLIKGVRAIKSVGAHKSEEFFNNCTACHGFKNRHPKEKSEIIVFSEHSNQSIQVQNDKCMDCHSPESISTIEWTHDVHFTDVICSSCHDLHDDVDKMKKISPTDRILICIDCHGI